MNESTVRTTVAIGSGKGGVGKSTVTLNLALLLAEQGMKVGVLDADVSGPNIPLMLNIKRSTAASGWTLAKNPLLGRRRLEPIETHGIKVMSMALAISEEQALSWSGGLVTALLHQLLRDVDWGELDLLLVDMPPGTGDIHLVICDAAHLDGVVLVVTPQDVAHLDAKRAVEMYRQKGVRVLGAVQNMSGLRCPHCEGHVDVFRPVAEDRALWSAGVPMLGAIPLDPTLSELQDGGRPPALDGNGSASVAAMRRVADELGKLLAEEGR